MGNSEPSRAAEVVERAQLRKKGQLTVPPQVRRALHLKKLTLQQRQRFMATVLAEFVLDLKAGGFRPGPRVKRVMGTSSVWEMTWAPDGRATFEYGDEQRLGETHVVWRRVGTHNIFRNP